MRILKLATVFLPCKTAGFLAFRQSIIHAPLRRPAGSPFDRPFGSAHVLLQHQQTSDHFPTHICGSCNRSFDSCKALVQHQQALDHFPRNPTIKCGNCDRSFSSREALVKHQQALDHLSKHKYGNCDRSFDSRKALEQHTESKHPASTKCPSCGEVRFRSFASAMQHLESGQCPNCRGKDHARRQVFTAISPHLRNEQNKAILLLPSSSKAGGEQIPSKPYSCDQCSKSFKELNQLMQHKSAKHKSKLTLGGGRNQLPPGSQHVLR